MPSNDIYELTVRQLINSQNVSNVHHFKQSGADGSGTGEFALDTIWNAAFKPFYLAVCVNVLQVVDLSIRKIRPVQTQPTVFPVAEFGTDVAAGYPTHSCVILRQFATPAGRKGTGHMKIPSPPITGVNEGRINLVYATQLKVLGDSYEAQHTDVASGYTFDPVVYSQVDNVGRKILKSVPAVRVRTCHSRQIGVGD